MTLSSATSNSMVVTWTVGASSGTSAATAYKVGWTEGGTGRTWVSSAPHYPLSSSPLTLTGLIVNTACNVTVTPLNSAGEGIQTTRMLSTTAAEAPPPTDSLPAKVVGGYYPKSPRKKKLNNFCCSPLAHCGVVCRLQCSHCGASDALHCIQRRAPTCPTYSCATPNWTPSPVRIRDVNDNYNLIYLFHAQPVGGPRAAPVRCTSISPAMAGAPRPIWWRISDMRAPSRDARSSCPSVAPATG